MQLNYTVDNKVWVYNLPKYVAYGGYLGILSDQIEFFKRTEMKMKMKIRVMESPGRRY